MKKISIIFFLLLSFLFACKREVRNSPLKTGGWKGVLTLIDSTGLILPFRFQVDFDQDKEKELSITVFNADDKIIVDEIRFEKDSIFIQMPVFDTEFKCKLTGDSLLTGNWYNHARKEKNVIPFTATYGDSDIYGCPDFESSFDFNGRWKCLFSPNEPDSAYVIGEFKVKDKKATGTFLTQSGDYGYLQGCSFGKYMLLYNFDGSHAYVFHAEVTEEGMIWGEFYSGIHHHETWLGWKDNSFKLTNPDSLTFMKQGSSKIDFSFKNTEGKMISLSDEKYKNKVVVVQIMGSWCPNCKDETAFLTEAYNNYRSKGLEVIGLSFEKAEDFEKAKSNVLRFKNKYNSEYEFLITGYPPKEAEKALPMLNHIISFPTTIYIDRKGVVRKIYTGYPGPATGKEHELFVQKTNSFLEQMLAE